MSSGIGSIEKPLTAEKLEQSVRIIRKGYLELALKTRDLADKQQALVDYLKEDLVGEASVRGPRSPHVDVGEMTSVSATAT